MALEVTWKQPFLKTEPFKYVFGTTEKKLEPQKSKTDSHLIRYNFQLWKPKQPNRKALIKYNSSISIQIKPKNLFLKEMKPKQNQFCFKFVDLFNIFEND